MSGEITSNSENLTNSGEMDYLETGGGEHPSTLIIPCDGTNLHDNNDEEIIEEQVNSLPDVNSTHTSTDIDGEVTGVDSEHAQSIDIEGFADFATKVSRRHIAHTSGSNQAKLEELVSHQKILLESLEHENEKFSASDCFRQMEDMMSKCREYNSKLLRLKKSMSSINQRTTKIKKQCYKLQELKAKTLVSEEEARRKEMERERLLVAQPVKTYPNINTDPSVSTDPSVDTDPSVSTDPTVKTDSS